MGYKVTNPSAGVWHYEYALFNMNLDRAIQSFSVPLGAGVNISNIGFQRRLSNPAGQTTARLTTRVTAARRGTVTQDANSITWSTETFATEPERQRDSLGHIV